MKKVYNIEVDVSEKLKLESNKKYAVMVPVIIIN